MNLIKNQQPDIDKIHSNQNINCLIMESKHQLLINGRGKVGIENLKNQKASMIILEQLIRFMKI